MSSIVHVQLRLGGSLAALALSVAMAPAFAQGQAPAEDAATALSPQVADAPVDTAAQTPADVASTADIVVTGSLIARPNNVAVSPIVTVSDELVQQSGQITLEDSLNQLPGFTPSGNAGTGGQGGGGRATLNLRGLGSNRNLILLDGRRLPLSDINGNVDINILPESIIGSVDVITGGASAIYGSDAMSGVVTFKTDKYFDGVRADIQNGDSFRGDYGKFNASLALGTKFADDRGRLMLALSYAQRDPLSGSQRSFFDDKVPSSFIGTGAFVPDALNLPSQAALNGVFAQYGVTNPINPTLNLGFNDNGSLFVQTGAINYQGPTTGAYAVVGGNVRMPVGPQLQILNAFERKSAFAKGEFDLTETLTAYGQFLYVDSTVTTESGGSLTQFAPFTTIPVTNPFIPADLQTLLASRADPAAPFRWSARYVGIPDKGWDENYRVQQYLAGLKGTIAGSWKFDAFASYDETVHNQSMFNAVLKNRVQTLLNAPDGGASICAGGFNPFGIANATSLSQECQDYMTATINSRERLTQTQVQGQINGPLFNLPAGPVQLALLAGYRKNTYKYDPSPDLVSNNVESVVGSNPARGEISVKEFAAQLDVPLLSDTPFFHELGIGAAFRYSDYKPSGSVESYEVDARWQPVEALLIRGSYQRAVRAPNIGELFSPVTGSQLAIGTPPAAIGDPCDIRSAARTGANGAQVRELCLAQGIPAAAIDAYQFATTATGGNIQGNSSLTPEKANTFNVGFVLNPRFASPWLSGFSLSVDYYNIKIRNVISTINGLTVLAKCYNLDGSNSSYSNSNEFCQLIQRDPTGQLVAIAQPYLNLGALDTDGIDVQVNWSLKLAEAGIGDGSGKIYASSAIGWLNHYKVQTLPGTAAQDFVGTSTPGRPLPKWKALTTVGYSSDVFGIGLRWRYQGKLRDISAITTPAAEQVGLKPYNLFDIFSTVDVTRNFQLRGGITNLFDRDIPFVASSQNGTDAGTYDMVGRSFYVGAKFNF
ncbi:MAG: TonB-dependent receptor [Pseudomonadota bacterium]|nr:TonB-dependent receptor [Pseudomonadota bacterium]